jgi:hypothetical protein
MATTKKKAVTKKTVKKKAVKKKAVKKAAVKKAAPKKAATKKAASSAKIKVTHEQHHKMICEAAYYISLDRTSETVNPTEDWLQAEAAINKICIIAD